MIPQRPKSRERRQRPACFRAVRASVTREGPDSIHLHMRVDGGKQLAFRVPRALALEIASHLESATWPTAQ